MKIKAESDGNGGVFLKYKPIYLVIAVVTVLILVSNAGYNFYQNVTRARATSLGDLEIRLTKVDNELKTEIEKGKTENAGQNQTLTMLCTRLDDIKEQLNKMDRKLERIK